MVMNGNIELERIIEDIDTSAVAVVPGMDVIAPMGDEVEGSEEDAEGEEDWSHVAAHDTTMIVSHYNQHEHYLEESESEQGAVHRSSSSEYQYRNIRDPSQLLDSVPRPTSEEEVSAASTSSSDDDFEEELAIEEDEDEEVDYDDDEDEEFVLNPRHRQRHSMSTGRRSRAGTASNPTVPLIKEGAPELADEFDTYPVSEARSSQGRHRTRPSSSLGVPVPVPNLTKKSRGRRVPTMSSLEDLRSAASGAGKKRQSAGGKSARMYLCDVEGCGKCFARGEHLKRHVRSIHTYEKRKSLTLGIYSSVRSNLYIFVAHKCPYPGCGKDFSRHDNLGQHMRVHKDYIPPSIIGRRKT